MTFNLKKLFELQKEYDQAMYQKQGITNQDELFDRRIIAVLVELGEVSNEIQYFKYWKSTINTDKDKIAYELIDVLCFLMSFAFIHDLKSTFTIKENNNQNMTNIFIDIYKNVIKYQETKKPIYINRSIKLVLEIAYMLKIDLKMLEQYHQEKIKITFQRLKDNY